jgi:DMSO reductase anchor subunit
MQRSPNWPAQAFLVLFPGAVGCLLGGLILDSSGAQGGFVIATMTVALVLAVVSAAVPVLAIKKPLRSYRMLNGVVRSPLSRQVLLVGLFLVVLIVEWALALAGIFAPWLAIVTVVLGAGATTTAGLTYVLGAQPAWRHWAEPATLLAGLLTLGLPLALVVALGWRESLLGLSVGQIVCLVLVLAGVCILGLAAYARTRYLAKGGFATTETRALVGGRYRSIRQVGLVLAVLVTGVGAAVSFASPWVIIVALVASLAGLWMLRYLFFVTAAPLSWKSEVRWTLSPDVITKEA